MAGFNIVTDLEAADVADIVHKSGRRLDFTVTEYEKGEFTFQKGNLALSIFLGAFIAYCNFQVTVRRLRDESVEVVIERNTPWWTGIIGVNRVKSRAKELTDEIEDALRDARGRILHRESF